MDEKYVKKLEATIASFLAPLKEIPFSIVIKALTGHNIIPFDKAKNRELLEKLSRAAHTAGKRAFKEGIFTDRPNEAGNRIEPYVMKALKEVGLDASKPVTKSGKKRAAGYPDIQIVASGNVIYLDCKTYSAKTKDQTFRTFYFSPSEDPKITADAHHLLMSFELDVDTRNGRRAFIPVRWQIYSLENLLVEVKHEFNASNVDLYKREALLAEGELDKF